MTAFIQSIFLAIIEAIIAAVSRAKDAREIPAEIQSAKRRENDAELAARLAPGGDVLVDILRKHDL